MGLEHCSNYRVTVVDLYFCRCPQGTISSSGLRAMCSDCKLFSPIHELKSATLIIGILTPLRLCIVDWYALTSDARHRTRRMSSPECRTFCRGSRKPSPRRTPYPHHTIHAGPRTRIVGAVCFVLVTIDGPENATEWDTSTALSKCLVLRVPVEHAGHESMHVLAGGHFSL